MEQKLRLAPHARHDVLSEHLHLDWLETLAELTRFTAAWITRRHA